ncbi:cyclic peptide export ABC transporter [Deltaproteobacteria bacterium TL4]
MLLLKLISNESPKIRNNILMMGAFSGIVNAALLSVINSTASGVNNYKNLSLYLLMVISFIVSKQYALAKAAELAELVIKKIRLRILDKIRNSDLLLIENIGTASVYRRLTGDTQHISMGFAASVNSFQAGVMVTCSILYVSVLFYPAFVIIALVFALCSLVYFPNSAQIKNIIHESTKKEIDFFQLINHVLDGFKEIKINRVKNNDLYEQYLAPTADDTMKLRVKFLVKFANNFIVSQSFVYILVAVILFVVPQIFPTFDGKIVPVVAVVLFIIGPFNQILSTMPEIYDATVALENLYNFESKLDGVKIEETQSPYAVRQYEKFKEIHFHELQFGYEDSRGISGFQLGPLNLSVKSNEILFLIGGNGSGKSTLLKLLCGLYFPNSGEIKLDDQLIQPEHYENFRQLFSIIFTDFHLFDRLYGLKDIDEERVHQLLHQMQIDEKTLYLDDRFSHTDLSTGQRKRLALVCALLEDKSIYVLDEWAADQDPQFRQYFYEHLLPELKKQGKTVIAATHDDRYFHVADRVLKMEYGNFVPVVLPPPKAEK